MSKKTKPKVKSKFWPLACPTCQRQLAQYFIHRELPPGEWLRCEACVQTPNTEVTLAVGGAFKVKTEYVARDAISTPPVVQVNAALAQRARYIGAMRVYAEAVCYVFLDPTTRTFYAQPAG